MDNQQIKEKRTDITINGNIATFELSFQSLLKGTIIGTFTLRPFLMPMQELEAGRDRRRLLGELEQYANAEERYLALCLSELRQRIINAPPFWNTSEMFGGGQEKDLIFKVADAAFYAENLFTEQKTAEKEKLLKSAMAQGEKIIQQRQDQEKSEDKKAKEELDLDAELEDDK